MTEFQALWQQSILRLVTVFVLFSILRWNGSVNPLKFIGPLRLRRCMELAERINCFTGTAQLLHHSLKCKYVDNVAILVPTHSISLCMTEINIELETKMLPQIDRFTFYSIAARSKNVISLSFNRS